MRESGDSEMHIQVRQGTPIEEADRIAEHVRERVEQATGCRYCIIHADPIQEIQD
jgi:divalent metal cation (Fe/Co/Zn/Cd) transporter